MRTVITRLIALGLCAALATGCASREPEKVDESVLNVPGVYNRGDGSVTAVGVLMAVQDGNRRYWALVDPSQRQESSELPSVVVVITNAFEVYYRENSGSVVAMHGFVSQTPNDVANAPEMKVEGTAFLATDEDALVLDREAALSEPGLYATQDGLLLAVGELTFFDTSTPGERIWALRYPAEEPEQMGVAYVAMLANYDELTLGDENSPRVPLVAVEGLHVEDALNSMGVPRIEVENVLDAGSQR